MKSEIDILINAFPRSGNHWLKEIIKECFEVKNTIFVHTLPYELYNFSTYINSKKQIYLYRNPYDVLYSFYIYLITSGRLENIYTFKEFIMGEIGKIYKFKKDVTEHGLFYNPAACWDKHVYWGKKFIHNTINYDELRTDENLIGVEKIIGKCKNEKIINEPLASADGLIKASFYSIEYYDTEMLDFVEKNIDYNKDAIIS